MKKRVPSDNFFRSHEPNCVPEMNLNHMQNMSIYYPSGKYKLSVRSFIECCYIIVFVHYNSEFVRHKRMVWCMIEKQPKYFRALNLKIIFINSFTCNNINEILFLH